MPPIAHPGRLLKRELEARGLSASRLALDLGVPSDLTKRTRTITGDKGAFLFTWDDWKYENGELLTRQYAVTVVTYQSLPKYFGLDG